MSSLNSTSKDESVELTGELRKFSVAELNAAVADPALSEDRALALLKNPELTAGILEKLSNSAAVVKSRKLKLALIEHPRTPRHVSATLLAALFTFDLMRVTLLPVLPADLKAAAERALIHRLDKIQSGERLSLARRASGAVAGALLTDSEPRIVRTALHNPRLTEASVIKALSRPRVSAALVEAVCHHSHWSPRREVRMALLRTETLPLAPALEFARSLPRPTLHEILQNSRLPNSVKSCLEKDLAFPSADAANPTGRLRQTGN